MQAGSILQWDDIRYDPGQNFDSTTGAYVAPYDGFYSFNVAIANNRRAGFFILVDGKRVNYIINPQSSAGDGSTHATLGVHINLKAGQRVQVEIYETGTVYGKYTSGSAANGILTRSYFTGTMVYWE